VLRTLLRTCYSRAPFKKELFSALRRVWCPPERVFRHLWFEGEFPVHYGDRHFHLYHCGTWIENTIFWEGLGKTWEPASLSLWAQLCERSRTIVDVGANTGVYAALAAALNPNARVVAFEPNWRFARGISACNRVNGFSVEVHGVALSDSEGDRPYDGYQLVSERTAGARPTPTTTLARIIEQEGLESIDLMKLDVEGHEPQVLLGMGEYLRRFRPNMLLEIIGLDPDAGEEQAQRIRPLLRDLDYVFYSVDDCRGTARRLPELQASDFWNVLVCRPEAAATLVLPSGRDRHRR
jgi:FkbM family methyltransferase